MTKLSRLALAIGAALAVAPIPAQGTPSPNLDRAHHVLRRMTFGPNRALVTQLSTGLPAVLTYIAAQLSPPPASSPNYRGTQNLDQLLTGTITPGTHGTLELPDNPGGLLDQTKTSTVQVAYALESPWQLREVMTQFWERHFNTAVYLQRGYFTPWVAANSDDDWAWWFELEANEFYRQNCFTTFYDLLYFTSRHASMMVYLHLPQNNGSNPNEDYARELCELYTMSPEHLPPTGAGLSNYTQLDIEQVARILTGWDVDEQNAFVFQYDDIDHAYPTGSTTTLFASSGAPITIQAPSAGNGQQEGLDLLAEIARHPATVTFICRKLIAHFIDESVANQQNPTVLQSMRAVWGQQGDLTAVLTALFTSSEFFAPACHLTRVRMPLESVVGTARAIEAEMKKDPTSNLADPLSLIILGGSMLAQGQSLLLYPAPNGFPADNLSQLSPSIGLERATFGWNVLLYQVPNLAPKTDVLGFVQNVQPPLPANPTMANIGPHLMAVIDHMLGSFYGSNYSLADEQRVANAMIGAMNWVNTQPNGPYDPANQQHYITTLLAAASCALGMVQSGQR